MIYLFEQQNYRDRGETEKSSIYWITPQAATMARAGPEQNQEPGASSRSPDMSGKIPNIAPSCIPIPHLPFPRHMQGAALEVKQLELKQVPTW